MVSQVKCECGYIARNPTDDGVVELILAHIRLDHPDLVPTVGAEDVRGWIEMVG